MMMMIIYTPLSSYLYVANLGVLPYVIPGNFLSFQGIKTPALVLPMRRLLVYLLPHPVPIALRSFYTLPFHRITYLYVKRVARRAVPTPGKIGLGSRF